MTPRKKAATPVADTAWSETVGLLPHKVVAEERVSRKGAIYLRWWLAAEGNWRWKSLTRELERAGLGATTLRDAHGVVIPAVAAWAVEQAWAQYRVLAGLDPAADVPGAPSAAPLTLGRTWAALTNPDTGLYHTDELSDHAKEVQRQLAFATAVWGADTSWAVLGPGDWTKLMRRRLRELLARRDEATSERTKRITGLRATEITITRVLTVARWLRNRMLIPATAALCASDWREEMRRTWLELTKEKAVPKPQRARYTHDEVLALLRAAWRVDPRMGLLLSLAAEYRLGQAIRSTRRDLVLDATPAAPHGRFTIHGKGKKKGETVYLTAGQRADVDRALAGYLAPLEAAYQAGERDDYALFPSGRLRGRKHQAETGAAVLGDAMDTTKPVHKDWIAKTLRTVESTARVPMPDGTERGITHVPGRLAYGARRENVDGALAEKVTDEVLKATGGWSSGDVPRGTYAEEENTVGRVGAMELRAKRRGEVTSEPATESSEEQP